MILKYIWSLSLSWWLC